jgi:cation diffusion facilitator CzcD-associated flavoprotein CzcO
MHSMIGFDTSGKLPFPILGKNGVDISKKHEPYPRSYLGITTDGFPNMFHPLGPNSGVGAGSLLVIMEYQINYAVAVISKLQRERLKSIEVTKEAVDDFDEFIEVCLCVERLWHRR